MNKTRITLILALAASLWSCQAVSDKVDIVATVYDKHLTKEELREVIPDNTSIEDSIFLTERYIDGWIKEQVVLVSAENFVAEESQEFEKELENYRLSLLTYAYETQVIKQKLDTVIQENEISQYYEDNIENFALKDYIIHAKFCVFDSLSRIPENFDDIFFAEELENTGELESICVENEALYFIDEDRWLYFGEFLEQIPIQVLDIKSFLMKNKELKFNKDGKQYYVQFIDYKLKDDVSPMSIEKENIKNIILNKRKIDLLNKMRTDLYNEALKKNKIETYYD